MKRRQISGLGSRDDIANDLIRDYKNSSAEKITLLTGPSGCGKSYVLHKIITGCAKTFRNLVNIRTFINFGDSFIEATGLRTAPQLSEASITIGNPVVSIGAGVGIHSDTTQYQLTRSILRKAINSDTLICIDDISHADNSVKALAKIILVHLDELEKELRHKIYFIFTDTEESTCINFTFSFSSYINHISFQRYTEKDICDYLEKTHIITLTEKMRRNISQIHKICDGSLSLVDFLFVDIAVQDNNYFDALEQVINYRLQRLKESGIINKVAEADMEDIILSAALSLQRFSSNEISLVTRRDDNMVLNSLDLAKNEAFLDKDHDCFFDFSCAEIKDILKNQGLDKRKERLLHYYQYYTEHEQDEYFFRAYYLIKYAGKVTSQAFALLGLSYIYGFHLSDQDIISKIDKLMEDYADIEQISQFDTLKTFYSQLASDSRDDREIYSNYRKIKGACHEIPLQGELARAFFHYLYRNCPPYDRILQLIYEECLQFARNELSLSQFTNPIGLLPLDETIIRLNLVYTVSPYLLDARNESEQFTELYQLSQSLAKNCKTKGAKGIAQYIENVFNRKAFLFCNQTQCDIYYEKAKAYFTKAQIWEEVCITLVCQAGTNIVIQKYEDAQAECNRALEIAREYGISIPQSAKLYNNLSIAAFLEVEQQTSSRNKCISKARETIAILKKQLYKVPCATEFVILTNLCSLSLYCGNDQTYLRYKHSLEKLMDCEDVSDILNEDIDDFYRYYFAWFEAYRMVRDGRWEAAQEICISLKGFVPSLFKKQEIFWDKKVSALSELIETKKALSSYDFCNRLVKTSQRENILSKFFFRGLMLSDLQYTSYN